MPRPQSALLNEYIKIWMCKEVSKSSVGWKWSLAPQTPISRISGANISTSSVDAVLIQLLLYFAGELSYQHHSEELLNYLWLLVAWVFIYFSYLTSGNKKYLCLRLVLCLKGCKVKGVNVSFVRNTSLLSWIENQAKCFRRSLSCPKSPHHSLLQFRCVSVNCSFFFGVFLNLSRSGRESWGLNVDVAGGYSWKKLQHRLLHCCNLT